MVHMRVITFKTYGMSVLTSEPCDRQQGTIDRRRVESAARETRLKHVVVAFVGGSERIDWKGDGRADETPLREGAAGLPVSPHDLVVPWEEEVALPLPEEVPALPRLVPLEHLLVTA